MLAQDSLLVPVSIPKRAVLPGHACREGVYPHRDFDRDRDPRDYGRFGGGQINPQAERARAGEAIALLTVIRQAEESYRFDHSDYKLIALAGTDADWDEIGVTNPNNNPNRYFNFAVIPSSVTPAPNFIAIAQRNARNDSPGGCTGTFQGRMIGARNTGAFCGNHPFTPATGVCN